MRYGSLCSGIEAASVAWGPLGWKPQFFSEIEKFPSAVLREHYPDVPNFGDMTQFKEWPDAAIDVLVGGTPCQSFSVAGLRKGLDDPRGNLALTYLAIAERYRPEWLVWENVPGVLSSNGGRDFGSFLGALAELGYGFAYRVLDAQYFGVAQRRRRVFVIGNAGDWRRAAAVLFDAESMSGNPPPRREARERVAAYAASSIGAYSEGVGTLRANGGDCHGGSETLITSTGDVAHRLNAGGGLGTDTELDGGLIPQGWPAQVAPTLNAAFGDKMGLEDQHALNGAGLFVPDVVGTGSGQGAATAAVAFSSKDYGADAEDDLCPTLRAGGHDKSHANAGIPPAVAFDMRGREGGAMPEGPHDTANLRAASGGSSRSYVAEPWAVRRLMPVECEFLQGFPRGYTAIPWRGKPADQCPDGPRYKALGNSMAVPVMRWIGERIQMVQKIKEPKQ